MGRRIRELRGFDMTQSEVALRVGVTQGHLSSLERGDKEAGAAVLLAISREFGKSVDWLLTGKAHVEPKKRGARNPTEPDAQKLECREKRCLDHPIFLLSLRDLANLVLSSSLPSNRNGPGGGSFHVCNLAELPTARIDQPRKDC